MLLNLGTTTEQSEILYDWNHLVVCVMYGNPWQSFTCLHIDDNFACFILLTVAISCYSLVKLLL